MTLRLEHLTVEHLTDPVGVDAPPRFGWHVVADEPGVGQLARRILVTGPDGSVWDSGEVADDRCSEIDDVDPPLAPLTRYSWRVEVTTTAGAVTGEGTFVTGLLGADLRAAAWIGGPGGSAAPLLRTEFDVPAQPAEAWLVVAAGGYARVEIDGAPAGPRHLSPAFRDYDNAVPYTVSDVTGVFGPGRHAIGAELGREFYGIRGRNTWEWERSPWHAEPCLRLMLLLRYGDGTDQPVVTSSSWTAAEGPTRSDDLYAGEDYDAREERSDWSSPGHDDGDWSPVTLVPGPRGRLVAQRQQPVAVVDELEPEAVTPLGPRRWVLSYPRVVAGWAALRTRAATGEQIELHFGEKRRPDGSVNNDDEQGFLDGRFQTDRVTADGSDLRWERRFGYHGFQHVEVRARELPDVRARVAHTAAARTGGFSCAEPLLNRLHAMAVRTLENNLHHLPTDTPMYEKNGWTGDGLLGAEMMLLNLDVHELLASWCEDIAVSRHGTGAPAVIAPCGGWSLDWSPAPVWHAALLLVPWEIYRQRGDRRVLASIWPDARDYLRFEVARSPECLADSTLTDYLSPETSIRGGNGPEDTRIAATAVVARMCQVAARIARVLEEDPGEWETAAARFREAFVRHFYDADSAVVRSAVDGPEVGYRQTPAVLALAFDLLPTSERQRVADRLAADVRERGDHLSTGALGTKHVLPVLTRFGHADAAWDVATQTTFPSWGFWAEQGATTMWEHWRPESRSRDHYFMGTVEDWLYSGVAGLAPLQPGWRRARVAPAVTDRLASASGHVTTPQGRLAVRWWHDDNRGVAADVEVPVGVVAEVGLPGLRRELGPGRHRVRA
ncbi:family 78 glycoside hydrolase catalytic domain [Georgenia deserti]|uniref:alpha-L-rhamnosidase n=1 Tax=Georgenia deserti TaxID=2093781 RepID=A0ABW4L6B1_9MICO